ncbi:MAG: acylphosphatase [Planctomycetota bacterium]|jgi:acylphosphatase
MTVVYSGRVQGVGFRFTTQRLASRYEVSGWVRNEPDGTVMLVAEGATPVLGRFLEAIRTTMSGCISDAKIVQGEATREFEGFSVRY